MLQMSSLHIKKFLDNILASYSEIQFCTQILQSSCFNANVVFTY